MWSRLNRLSSIARRIYLRALIAILGELGKDAAKIAIASFQGDLGLGSVETQRQKNGSLDITVRLLK